MLEGLAFNTPILQSRNDSSWTEAAGRARS